MGNNLVYSASPDTFVSSVNGSIVNGEHSDFRYAAATVQGWRKNQEDRYKSIVNLTEDYSYFAVFDGHGGFEIAEYLRRNFHNVVEEYIGFNPDDVELALHLAFLDFDSHLRKPDVLSVLNKMVEESVSGTVAARILQTGGMGSSSLAEIPRDVLHKNDSKNTASSTSKLGEATESKSSVNEKSECGPSGSSVASGSSKYDKPDNDPSCSSDVSPGPIFFTQTRSMGGPLHYLLNDELDPTDSEDSDFDIEDEESSSEGSDEDMNLSPEAIAQQEPGDLSGSTATVVLIGKNNIHVANVGDSRCILSRNGKAIDLSMDHNLDNEDERQRVTSAGATVSSDGRVNNSINISRAFGDFHLKGSSDIPTEQPVIAEPYVKTVNVTKEDDFVIIASDGIWNSFSSQELVDFVHQRIKHKDGSLVDICEEVFKFIMPEEISEDGTGCDNMTMIIVKLHTTTEEEYLITDTCVDDFEEDNGDMDCS